MVEGELQAGEQLLTRCEVRLFRFFCRLGCAPGSCDDLVQAVLLRLHAQQARYDPTRPFGAWLYGIARNVWREHVRERTQDHNGLGQRSRLAPIESEVGPLERAEGAEARDRLRRALLQLPPGERLTLVLRYWQGLSCQEIAETLGMPLATVKWRIQNAQRKLAQWLDPAEAAR